LRRRAPAPIVAASAGRVADEASAALAEGIMGEPPKFTAAASTAAPIHLNIEGSKVLAQRAEP